MESKGRRRRGVSKSNSDCRRGGSVQVHDGREAVAKLLGHSGNHHPAIRMTNQHDAVEILPLDFADHIVNLRREVDRAGRQMRTLTNAESVGARRSGPWLSGDRGRAARPSPSRPVNQHKGAGMRGRVGQRNRGNFGAGKETQAHG